MPRKTRVSIDGLHALLDASSLGRPDHVSESGHTLTWVFEDDAERHCVHLSILLGARWTAYYLLFVFDYRDRDRLDDPAPLLIEASIAPALFGSIIDGVLAHIAASGVHRIA